MQRVPVHPPPEEIVATDLRIHLESLTPLRGTVSDGEEPVPFQGWLQLLVWLEDHLGRRAAVDEGAGDD